MIKSRMASLMTRSQNSAISDVKRNVLIVVNKKGYVLKNAIIIVFAVSIGLVPAIGTRTGAISS